MNTQKLHRNIIKITSVNNEEGYCSVNNVFKFYNSK